ncbi:NADH-quinone oxidoreductase subunit NuoG [Propionivibrio sp.]|uniref:NADH-quinone oxidoreductase subunit NuoG n=1 Tax=Propionivibrio sp. TaxID=2212460 RepID=UPI00272E6257|nr:NADH-quinone oxidoreductase subunit NuoG [Propionivibrio sp.]
MLDIEIDGKQVQVPAGSTIMEAAQASGTYIPHFCYHKKLSIAANCRMCMVQVEKAPKPLPACATPVTNGMKVFTHSELAIKAQKGVMEFLLINHPLDCPICDQGGECQLQDLSVGYGGGSSRYGEAKRVVFQKHVGPLISMQEMSRCIHCTRCVRFGQEIAGVMELGMAGRNMHSEIQTFVGRTIDSELSGNMIDLCPVGALTSKPFRYSARSWELSRRKSVSPHDSFGTNLTVQVKNNRVMRVLPRENEEINECWISDKDRFSYEALNSSNRLLKPMVRVDGALREVEWNVALDYVAHGLRDIVKNHGGDSIAALASPRSTLEELFLLQKLVRGSGSDNIDFRPRRRDYSSDGKLAGIPWLGMRIADIRNLESVLVVGSFLRKDHPLFSQRLRQLAKVPGNKISLLSVAGDDPLINLHQHVSVAPGELPLSIAAVLKAFVQISGLTTSVDLSDVEVSEGCRAIAESFLGSGPKAIFLGNVSEQVSCAGQLHALAQELARLSDASFGFIGEASNSVGGYLAKAVPDRGKGHNAYEMFAQPRKAYILMGIEPEFDCIDPQMAVGALKKAELVVALSTFKSNEADMYADVLLPVAPFTETSGTYVSAEGRVQSVSGVCHPAGECRPGWKVLRVLGNLLDLPGFDYESSEQVKNELLPEGSVFLEGLSNDVALDIVPLSVSRQGLERIADVPIYFADALVRNAESLQKTRDASAPVARLNPATLKDLGLAANDPVRIIQGEGSVVLNAVADDTVPRSSVRVAAAHASTAALGEMFGTISVERA